MAERPRCQEELNRAAKYSLSAPMDMHALIRGVQDLLQQARIYEAEHDLETAYILFCRGYRMLSEDIPRHPDFGTVAPLVASRLIIASTQARLDTDRLRLLLEANYNAWRTTRRDKDSPSSSWRHDVQATSKSGIVSERASPAPADAGRLADPQALTDRSHRKLPRPSLMSPDEMPYIPMLRIHECTRPSFLRAVSSPPWQPHTQSIQALTSSGPQSVRHPQSSNTPPATAYLDPLSSSAGITRTSTAPPTSPRQPLDGLNIGPIFDNSKSPTHGVQGVPPRPPKILPSHVSAGYQPHPRKPASFIPVHSVEPASSSTSRAIRIPITSTEGEERITSLGSSSIHPPTKLHSPVAAASPSLVKTEGGKDLRSLILPSNLVDLFAAVAASNTEKNIETCGWIMGRLSKNVFLATLLIIPKQSGTSDTCTTRNEEEILLIAEEEDVITLGWIHTHPQHDCFLSSRDLHTQAGYQQMLPEAIAIVLAPRNKPNVGIFRLTDPPGLTVITRCQQGTTFHPHPNVPLYTEAGCEQGGHVTLLPDKFETRLIDLREEQ